MTATKGRLRGTHTFGWSGEFPKAMATVLHAIYIQGGLALDANYARENRVVVAMAASLGYISTVLPDERQYGTIWRLTPSGLACLHSLSTQEV